MREFAIHLQVILPLVLNNFNSYWPDDKMKEQYEKGCYYLKNPDTWKKIDYSKEMQTREYLANQISNHTFGPEPGTMFNQVFPLLTAEEKEDFVAYLNQSKRKKKPKTPDCPDILPWLATRIRSSREVKKQLSF